MIKPYFSSKVLYPSKIFLSQKGRLTKYHIARATTMNYCFVNIISLHLRENFGILKTSMKIQFNYFF